MSCLSYNNKHLLDLELTSLAWLLPDMSLILVSNWVDIIDEGTCKRLETQVISGWSLKVDEKNLQHRAFGKLVLF